MTAEAVIMGSMKRSMLVACLVGCATLHPLQFPTPEVSGKSKEDIVGALAAAGYTIQVASDAVVVTDWLEFHTQSTRGMYLHARDRMQVTLKDGLATLRVEAQCDWKNLGDFSPSTANAAAWELCKHSTVWPMPEVKQRFEDVASALGAEPSAAPAVPSKKKRRSSATGA